MAWSHQTVTQAKTILVDPMNISSLIKSLQLAFKEAAEIGAAVTLKSFSK